ncbi:MAG: hypothetical protein ACJAS4_002843 [Bacteriovoracaceae bacterium]|jgi:hypothetical protein
MKKIITPALIGTTILNVNAYATGTEEINTQSPTDKEEISENFIDSNSKLKTDNKSINELDLEAIIVGLTLKDEGPGWSIEKADRVAEKYKAYLYLVAKYPDKKIVPSKEVDEFWHAHILDTYKYMVDCDAIFGTYFHHYPYFGMQDEADKKDLDNSFQSTYELYLKEFPSVYSKEIIAKNALCIGENPDASTSLCIGETRDVRTALCIGETRDVRTALCIGETRDVRTALCIGENPDAINREIKDEFDRNGSFNSRPRPTINRKSNKVKF